MALGAFSGQFAQDQGPALHLRVSLEPRAGQCVGLAAVPASYELAKTVACFA